MEEGISINWLLTSFPHYAVVLSAFPVCFKVFAWVEDQLSANAKHEVTSWLKSVAKYAAGAKQFDLLKFHSKLFGDHFFDRKCLRRTLFFSFLAYSFILLPSMYFFFTTAGRPAAANFIDLCFMLALFLVVIFPLDFCGVVVTRKLSAVAGTNFTIKRSILIFSSDLIVKTIVFPIVFAIFTLFGVVVLLAISGQSGLIGIALHALMPNWLERAFHSESSSLIEILPSLNQNKALFEAFQLGPLDVLKGVLNTYLSLLPSVAICSAWVWLYAMALHAVRASVFLFDVDTKPIRSTGIVAALGLTVLLGVYKASTEFDSDTDTGDCASSSYYIILTWRGSDKSLDEAINLCPKSPIAYRLRATRYSAAQEYDRAIADLSEAILLDADPFFPLLKRADAYVAKGDYDLAISDFDRAVELRQDKESLYLRGRAHAANGSYEKSIADYDRAIQLDSTYGDALYSRGVSRDQQKDHSSAIADFRRAIAADPEDAYSALWLFLVSARSEPTAAAEELAINATRLPRTKWPYPIVELMLGLRTADSTLAATSSPKESCDAHFFLGEWRLLEGDRTTARRFLGLAEGVCSKQTTMYFVAREENKQLRP
jgi:tetratricopeptide (TPR) repeat protein